MKKLLIALLALTGCCSSEAWQQHFFVDASATNIPAAFSSGASSLVLNNLVAPKVMTICNETPTRICINNQTYDSSTPASITHRVPSGQCMSTSSRYSYKVYISGCGSAISSGYAHGFSD